MEVKIQVDIDNIRRDEATNGSPEKREIPFRILGIPEVVHDKFTAFVEAPFTIAHAKEVILARCIKVKSEVQDRATFRDKFGGMAKFTLEVP